MSYDESFGKMNQQSLVEECTQRSMTTNADLSLAKDQSFIQGRSKDLETALDRIPHSLIWTALRSHGASDQYVQIIVDKDVTTRIR